LDLDKKDLTYYAQIIENSGRRITTVIDDIIDISCKYEGSGLGLAVSSGIIDRLGGKIRVESKVGQGTVFFVSIPRNMGNEEKAASTENDSSEFYYSIVKCVTGKKLFIRLFEKIGLKHLEQWIFRLYHSVNFSLSNRRLIRRNFSFDINCSNN
jgi:hypothetical protein